MTYIYVVACSYWEPIKIISVTNDIYICHQHVTLETMCLHSRDQSKKRKLIRFHIIIFLSENKDPTIRKKLINPNICIALQFIMYEIVQNMVLDKIQDAKGSAYTGICFSFFFRVEGKPHNASGGQTIFQSLESAAKSVDQSLDQCLSHLSHWHVEETFQ